MNALQQFTAAAQAVTRLKSQFSASIAAEEARKALTLLLDHTKARRAALEAEHNDTWEEWYDPRRPGETQMPDDQSEEFAAKFSDLDEAIQSFEHTLSELDFGLDALGRVPA